MIAERDLLRVRNFKEMSYGMQIAAVQSWLLAF